MVWNQTITDCLIYCFFTLVIAPLAFIGSMLITHKWIYPFFEPYFDFDPKDKKK